MASAKDQPLAVRAVISPVASAIRLAGQQGEAIRVQLDIYEDSDVMKQLMDLRGEELYVVLKRTD